MGGRGGGSGRRAEGGASGKPTYFGETEKAVQVGMSVYNPDYEQTVERKVWVPKSQLDEQGRPSEWISGQKLAEVTKGRSGNWEQKFTDAKGKDLTGGQTKSERVQSAQKAQRFMSGVERHDALISQAKSLGIKTGTRMKSDTLRKKIKDSGNTPVN